MSGQEGGNSDQAAGYKDSGMVAIEKNGAKRRVFGKAVDLRGGPKSPQELDCDTALCHYWFDNCGGILIFYDDSGDGKVDTFICDGNVD